MTPPDHQLIAHIGAHRNRLLPRMVTMSRRLRREPGPKVHRPVSAIPRAFMPGSGSCCRAHSRHAATVGRIAATASRSALGLSRRRKPTSPISLTSLAHALAGGDGGAGRYLLC